MNTDICLIIILISTVLFVTSTIGSECTNKLERSLLFDIIKVISIIITILAIIKLVILLF